MIGKIEWENITENKTLHENNYKSNKEKISRVLSIKILWYMEDWEFRRWIKELPLIDNQCFLLWKEEFEEIHRFTKSDDEPIRIWKLEYDDWQNIEVGINSLFASHIWIFGNTWSGKSYTLAKIYRELFNKFKNEDKFVKNAKFYFIDFNGEYIGDDVIIEKDYKNIYKLNTRLPEWWDRFPIRKDTIQDSTFWSIFLEATEKMQAPFLNRALKDTYIESMLSSDDNFKALLKEKIIAATAMSGKFIERSIVTDLLYEVSNYTENADLKTLANYFRDNLNWGNEKISFYLEDKLPWNYSWETWFIEKVDNAMAHIGILNIASLSFIRKIGLRIIIKYYDEMIRGFSNREHLSWVLKRLEKRINELEKVISLESKSIKTDEIKNISVISLKDVNISIRKMIPMLLCKEFYEIKKKDNSKNHSLHIIIDEAHNILSESSDRESWQWKDYRLETFEEIIKEWRKFWTFLTIASQRPSDISPTIISQLHNYFLHRLINNNDLLAVERTISYLDKVSSDSIPNLPTWTCILAWLLAQIPVVIRINKIWNINNEPQSQTIKLVNKWR